MLSLRRPSEGRTPQIPYNRVWIPAGQIAVRFGIKALETISEKPVGAKSRFYVNFV